MQKFQVPQIPAAFTRNLAEGLKNLQTQLSKAAAALPKQFELQRQFYSNIRLEPITLKVLVPFQKTDNPDLLQQVLPKPVKLKKTRNQIDWDAMKKELSEVKGSEVNDKGYLGKQRLIMSEKYGLNVRQIWEYENPDSEWRTIPTHEKHSARNTIYESIARARKKQSKK